MANYSVDRSKHATLVAATVDTVTLGIQVEAVEVVNRDAADAIYFTVDGTAPTVGGDNTFVLPAAICSLIVDVSNLGTTAVKLISAGIPQYTVQGIRGA